MPERICQWLHDRGISDKAINDYTITYDARRRKIILPVTDKKGIVLFNKYRRDPEDTEGPKYTYDKGATTALFGIKNILLSNEIIICEGEFDCILLSVYGFFGVTSTGGANSFQEMWAADFIDKDVYVCLDNDKAGREGIIRICSIIPHAKVIPLPIEVGEHGDITDFFIRLHKTTHDLRALMDVAMPLPITEEEICEPKKTKRNENDTDLIAAKSIPLDNFLRFNRQGFASCPFHTDKTPSLKRYKNNRWHCFSCGKHGDTIDLAMQEYNVSLPQAIKIMLKN